MPAARYVKLSEAEDAALLEVERNAGLSEKVRLRARVLRLSHYGVAVAKIAALVGRDDSTIQRWFDRWESQGMEGLADRYGPDFGRRSPLGEAEKAFLKEKLAEDRSWTATSLAEAVNERFGLKVNRESMRVCLLGMGYSWQRQRYVPVKTPCIEVLDKATKTLDELKKSQKRVKSP